MFYLITAILFFIFGRLSGKEYYKERLNDLEINFKRRLKITKNQ